MRSLTCRLATLLVPCLCACSGVDVRYEFDPRFDFNGFRAYDWHGVYGAPTDLVENATRDRIDAWLTKKGYQLLAPGVRLRAVVYFDLPPGAWDRDADAEPPGDSGADAARRIARAAGLRPPTVTLAFVDRRTLTPYWRGTVVGEFGDPISKREQLDAVARTIDALMAKFPPER